VEFSHFFGALMLLMFVDFPHLRASGHPFGLGYRVAAIAAEGAT